MCASQQRARKREDGLVLGRWGKGVFGAGRRWFAAAGLPVLVPVHDAGRDGVDVGARADEEQDDGEEGLEVEEGGLRGWVEARC